MQFHWGKPRLWQLRGIPGHPRLAQAQGAAAERAEAQRFGGEILALTGDAIAPAHWDAFWAFYQDNGARKWGQPYLTRAFFDRAARGTAGDVLLILAVRDGRPVAGALNLIGRDCLYGRYWGAIEHHPFLHFELCYHQAIDWAIARGLGGSRQARRASTSWRAAICRSSPIRLHWIGDAGFRRAVAEFLEAETRAVAQENAIMTAMGPFRRDGRDEQD